MNTGSETNSPPPVQFWDSPTASRPTPSLPCSVNEATKVKNDTTLLYIATRATHGQSCERLDILPGIPRSSTHTIGTQFAHWTRTSASTCLESNHRNLCQNHFFRGPANRDQLFRQSATFFLLAVMPFCLRHSIIQSALYR